MIRALVTLLLLSVALLTVWSIGTHAVAAEEKKPEDRVKQARTLREQKLRKLCSDHELTYPPKELFLRAMKREQILEVWAGEGEKPLKLLATYPLTASSGMLGPKRREGDRQIPEGVYYIDRFNPRSSYHLSLGVNYPNTSDRKFADPDKPGGDIFIHGRASSVGCLAIGDEAIEEVYVLAKDVSDRGTNKIPVHIYPARMDNPEWKPTETLEAEADPNLLTFWEDLGRIYSRFEDKRRPPEVGVSEEGQYQLAETKE